MLTIQTAVAIIVNKNVYRWIITILSDRQRVIKALNSAVMNSRRLYNCRRCLSQTTKRYDVCITWVPRHMDIVGNCQAKALARRGTIIERSDDFSTLGIPLVICKLIIDNAIVDLVGQLPTRAERNRKSGEGWIRGALRLWLHSKGVNSILTYGVITRHGIIGTHEGRVGLAHFANHFWKICSDEEENETLAHLLCTCPAFSRRRKM